MLFSAFKLPQCALKVILPLYIDLVVKVVFVWLFYTVPLGEVNNYFNERNSA